jgi:uncharacterized protein YoxC
MSEVANLLEALKAAAPAPVVSETPSISEFLETEVKALQVRQRQIQDDLQEKTREAQTLRETLLVVSGALQAVQHVAQHVKTRDEIANGVSQNNSA